MRNIKVPLIFLLSYSIFFISCSVISDESKSGEQVFLHEINSVKKPWNHEQFNEQNTFSFAIISDLNGGERAGVFSSAVEKINLLNPEFVLSVGDLVDGGTKDTLVFSDQLADFDLRASKLNAPFFHVGGNHDFTNHIMQDFWKKNYGATYYYFIYKKVLFLMLNSEDYSPERMEEIYQARDLVIKADEENILTEEEIREMEYYKMPERVYGELGDGQLAYFKKVISDHPEVVWTFVLMHKPVWQREDNHGLIQLEQALTPGKFTVINGHFHSYSHQIKNESDYMILGTTGGSQNPNDPNAFDHFTWINITDNGPSIANIKLEGIMDKTGN